MADGAKLVVGAMGPDQAREVKSSQKRGGSKKRRTSEEEVNNSFHAFTPPKKSELPKRHRNPFGRATDRFYCLLLILIDNCIWASGCASALILQMRHSKTSVHPISSIFATVSFSALGK